MSLQPPPPPVGYKPQESKHIDILLIVGVLGVLILIIIIAVRSSREPTASDAEQCFSPLISEFECLSNCTGFCETRYTTPSGLVCQECVPRDVERDIDCPEGTTGDLAFCNSQCPNGLCMQQVKSGESVCYACFSCPDGLVSSREVCEESCDGDCAVRGEKDKLHCWECPPSCQDTCASRGFNPENHDYSEFVRSQITPLSCVSDVLLQPNLVKIGSCVCSSEPKLIVDRTVPSCRNTACGDIACGATETCDTDVGRQATVTCAWGGWKEIAPGLFQPVISY